MPRVTDIRLLLYAMDKGHLDQSLVAACVSDMISAERADAPLEVTEVLSRRKLLEPTLVETLLRELLDVTAAGRQVVGADTVRTMSGAHALDGTLQAFGKVVAGYKVNRKLTWSGMDSVLQALDADGEPVVLRIMSEEAAIYEGIVGEFLQEAQLAATVQHPSFATVLTSGVDQGTPYVVSSFLPGKSLASWLQRGRLTPRDAIDVVAIVAHACGFLHHWGLVHRDLQPGNIVIGPEGEVGLINPGFGRDHLRQLTHGTPFCKSLGTPAYLAPEQARTDPRDIGTWTDVYALGAVLFRCLTGSFPHAASSFYGTLEFIATVKAPPLRVIRPDLPAEVDDVVGSAMAQDPAQRPTAGELAEMLNQLLRDVKLDHLDPPATTAPPS